MVSRYFVLSRVYSPFYLPSLLCASTPFLPNLPFPLPPCLPDFLITSSPPTPSPSTAGLPSDVTYFLGCGADKVLLKPLDFDAFGQAMRDLESEYPERMLGGVDESGMGNGLVGALRCSL